MEQDASSSVEWSDCHHWGDTPCYLLNNEKWRNMSIFQKSNKKDSQNYKAGQPYLNCYQIYRANPPRKDFQAHGQL